jgi:hypothetical protein
LSKADLIQNEDFKEYQDDIRKRLDGHIKTLHKILVQPIGTLEESDTKLTRMEATTALIVELETILGLPVSYLKEPERVETEKKKGATVFMDMFKAIFTRSETID